MKPSKPAYLLQTERLGLRPWHAADLKPFAVMNTDPDVMKYFPRVLTEDESNAGVHRQITQQETRGYCFWAADLLSSGSFIGFIGLSYNEMEADFTPCVEIGWRLIKSVWANGYATEGAHACLEFALDREDIKEVYSFTPLSNTPSERVMQKIGMSRIGSFGHPLVPEEHKLREHHLYHISTI